MAHAALGLVVLLGIAWAFSEDRRRILWRTVLGGVALLIGVPAANRALFVLNDVAEAIQKATLAGSAFVFGYLAGEPLAFAQTHPGASFILAFQALPFRPVLWLIGVPWADTGADTGAASALMATKMVLNELVAYLNFSTMPPDAFSPRIRMILTYALCGFANFGSLGIMIGGLGAMVPARRHDTGGTKFRPVSNMGLAGGHVRNQPHPSGSLTG